MKNRWRFRRPVHGGAIKAVTQGRLSVLRVGRLRFILLLGGVLGIWTSPYAADSAIRAAAWMQVWSLVREYYVGFDAAQTVHWESSYDSVLQAVLAAPSDVDFWRVMRQQVAALGDGQTRLRFPDGLPALYDAVPIRVVPVDGRFLVSQLSSSPLVKAEGIRRGDELIAVDEMSAREHFQRECLPHAEGANSAAREARAAWRLLTGPAGTQAMLKFRRPTGETYKCSLLRDSGEHNAYYWELFHDAPLQLKLLADSILYADLGRMVTRERESALLQQLRAQSAAAIILDAREWHAGDVPRDLLRCLAFFPIPLGPYIGTVRKMVASDDRELRAVWQPDTTNEEWIEPGEFTFRGRVVILTGPGSSGPAEQFLQPLVFARRAILIGDTTAGSGARAANFNLLGGGSIELSVMQPLWEDGCGRGHGFAPDLRVMQTPAALAANRDAGVEAALDFIRNSR